MEDIMITLLAVMLIIIGYYIEEKIDRFETAGQFIQIIGFVSTIFLVFAFLIVRFATTPYEVRRNSLQETYTQSRNFSEFERMQITRDIADFNAELALDKYWNETFLFDWWISDVVEKLEPIK
jgi:cell division protein FtsL